MESKNKKFIFLIIFYFFGLVYLVLPGPVIPVLPNSFRSTEPGDTWQFPGIWGYYTDLPRQEVVNVFRQAYGKSWLWGLPLPVIKLNHPVEYCQEKVRDTQWFSYCEELVNPLKESLFIGGFTPTEDDFYRRRVKTPIELKVEGKVYKTKVLLKHIESPIWARILVWIGIWGVILVLGKNFKKVTFELWSLKKKK